LAAGVNAAHGNTEAIVDADIAKAAATVDLVVNATTKGQAGLRKSALGATCLEPYVALAAANPAWVSDAGGDAHILAQWYAASTDDIIANQRAGAELIGAVPGGTAFVDLVYAPLETAMLRLARWSGHRTLNGKRMNIAQAVDAFANRVMGRHLVSAGWRGDELYTRAFDEMTRVW
jgi:shikimate 5-dehydrogenase